MRDKYDLLWHVGENIKPRIEKAKQMGYVLKETVFAGYVEAGEGVVAVYTLKFERVK